jgi:L-glyceraldehyde 3-phosphate reductase
MALGWLLKDKRVTSVLIGVSKAEQLIDSLQALENTNFSEDELSRIESILKG